MSAAPKFYYGFTPNGAGAVVTWTRRYKHPAPKERKEGQARMPVLPLSFSLAFTFAATTALTLAAGLRWWSMLAAISVLRCSLLLRHLKLRLRGASSLFHFMFVGPRL
ncbi:MAG: hypothetical protein QOD75_2708 [Blastocatellia bacterium]|nr:hypothetical protein [Blastocatellia bacterium]